MIQAFIAALIIAYLRVKKYFLHIKGILSFYIDPQTFLISIWQMKTISFARPELCLIDLKQRQKRLLPSTMLPRITQTNTDPNLVILSFPLDGCLSPIYTHTIFLSISPTHFYNAHIYKYSVAHTHNFSPFSPGSGDAVMTIGSRHRSELFI